MPGEEELLDMSFREARKEGLVREWQEAHRPDEPEKKTVPFTQRTKEPLPGDEIGVAQISQSGKLEKIVIQLKGNVESHYFLRLRLQRGKSEMRTTVENLSKQMELRDFGVDLSLEKGDVISVKLKSDEEEAVGLVESVVTIETTHA